MNEPGVGWCYHFFHTGYCRRGRSCPDLHHPNFADSTVIAIPQFCAKMMFVNSSLRGAPLFCNGPKPYQEYEFFKAIYDAARPYGLINRVAVSSMAGAQPATVFVEYQELVDARQARLRLGFYVSVCSSVVFRSYFSNINFNVIERFIPFVNNNQSVLRALSLLVNPLGAVFAPRDVFIRARCRVVACANLRCDFIHLRVCDDESFASIRLANEEDQQQHA